MRARHCPPLQPENDAYLGDVIDMEATPTVFRRVQPRDDYHWAKRAAFVVCGVVLVWWGLIMWVALP